MIDWYEAPMRGRSQNREAQPEASHQGWGTRPPCVRDRERAHKDARSSHLLHSARCADTRKTHGMGGTSGRAAPGKGTCIMPRSSRNTQHASSTSASLHSCMLPSSLLLQTITVLPCSLPIAPFLHDACRFGYLDLFWLALHPVPITPPPTFLPPHSPLFQNVRDRHGCGSDFCEKKKRVRPGENAQGEPP